MKHHVLLALVRCAGCDAGGTAPPTPETGVAACIDGLDNDQDGLTDCEDCTLF